MTQRKGVGIIGVGDISGIYLKNLHGMFREHIRVVGVCDLVRSKAEKAKETYPELRIFETDAELIADPEVEIVLNLTRPLEHFAVTRMALEAGKHVYTEKPLATNKADGQVLSDLAEAKGVRLGGAPDTFLGAGIQTCRDLIDRGTIGRLVGARAAMICRGHEGWHPDPAFYYAKGGGPLLDMGPYYVTALTNLLGPVRRVTARGYRAFDERLITSQPLNGTVVPVETDTTLHAILEFDEGVLATLFVTFDVVYNEQAHFEVYGTEGTLRVPDPNTFGGPIQLLRRGGDAYEDIPLNEGFPDNSRGLGLTDMVRALDSDAPASADRSQVKHALDIMLAIMESAETEQTLTISSGFERKPLFDPKL